MAKTVGTIVVKKSDDRNDPLSVTMTGDWNPVEIRAIHAMLVREHRIMMAKRRKGDAKTHK